MTVLSRESNRGWGAVSVKPNGVVPPKSQGKLNILQDSRGSKIGNIKEKSSLLVAMMNFLIHHSQFPLRGSSDPKEGLDLPWMSEP